MSKLSKSTLNSSWTPLNNETLNQRSYNASTGFSATVTLKPQQHQQQQRHQQLSIAAAGNSAAVDPLRAIFTERRALINKWFDKWGDAQRLAIMEDLISKCRVKNLEQAGVALSRRKPMLHEDFTRCLPRVLSIYLFSFLDPRSLSRCAQVCWHWKNITELDELWMRKCLRLGWSLSFNPSPYEAGMWKRFYIERIVALKNSMPSGGRNSSLALRDLGTPRMSEHGDLNSSRLNQSTSKRPPWKGTDPVPKDIWRNNYLDNDDEVTKVAKILKKNMYVTDHITQLTSRRAQHRITSARRNSARRSSSLTRSHSLQMLNDDSLASERPEDRQPWNYQRPPSTMSQAADLPRNPSSRGSKPPRPASAASHANNNNTADNNVSAAVAAHIGDRTVRDPPSVDLFPAQPWTLPTNNASSDEDGDDDIEDDENVSEMLDSNVY